MELTLHTEGWFDASHHLKDYDGKCSQSHGHTYKIEVWVKGDSSELNKAGILWDFGNLKRLLNIFDHKNLNDLYKFENSTAENQCIVIYNDLKKRNKNLNFKVRLYEQLEPKRSYCECGDF